MNIGIGISICLNSNSTMGESPIQSVISDYISRNPHFTASTISDVSAKLTEILDPEYVMPDSSANYYSVFIDPEDGLGKTTSEWIYLWKMTKTTLTRTNACTGATPKWHMGNSIYNQVNCPAHTFVTGEDWVIYTSTDSFAGLTSFTINTNGFTGEMPFFTFNTTLQYLVVYDNLFTGDLTLYHNYMIHWTTLYQFIIYSNLFTGDLSGWSALSTMTSPYRFQIQDNGFTGDLSTWSSLSTWTSMQRFNISENNFTGDLSYLSTWSTWVESTQLYFNENNFIGTFGNLDISGFPNLGLFRVQVNSITTIPTTFNSNLLTSIDATGCALTQTNVDALFANLNIFYTTNTPTRNVTVAISGGTNATPTGGASNTDIVNIKANFVTAGYVCTITTN